MARHSGFGAFLVEICFLVAVLVALTLPLIMRTLLISVYRNNTRRVQLQGAPCARKKDSVKEMHKGLTLTDPAVRRRTHKKTRGEHRTA